MHNFHQVLLLLFIPLIGFSQSQDYWQIQESDLSSNQRDIIPQKYEVFQLDELNMKTNLDRLEGKENMLVSLPMPNAAEINFELVYDPIMHQDLAAKFPNIRTYKAINPNDRTEWGRIDFTEKGLHGMLYTRAGIVFIDPYARDTPGSYVVYYKRDFISDKSETHSCGVETHSHQQELEEGEVSLNHYKGGGGATLEVRTYELAIAATGEYTAFHGGSENDAMSAIVTTMNRVNQVYEKELSIRMELIANNDLLIYTDAENDPYTNGATGTMINENQNNVNSVIGISNYDIGHVFGTNSGGLASLASVCKNSQKARGVTGSGAPVGDSFDIDYVSHELGHQFGANHTFNNCGGNENDDTAMEPGSGSTIMAYAGLCGSNNLQNNSDDYFHVASLEEILAYTSSGIAYSCADKTDTGNTGPMTSNVIASGFTIPRSTPFELEVTSTDAEGDDLTYCWEQYNIGPESDLGSPSGNAPLFRSFGPVEEPIRIFPKMENIVSGVFNSSEVLSNYTRDMDFKVTVRDNNPNGGIVDIQEVSFEVTANAGPFGVFRPTNANEVWFQGESAIVEWTIANTNVAPVNCNEVDIFLSIDGGFTYPITLAENVAYDGSHVITVPDNILSTEARVKVKASDNIFFDISNNDFWITYSTSNDDLVNDLDIRIYPNPTKDVLNIEMKDVQANDLELELYDMRGVLIARRNISNTLDQLDVSSFASGIYRISVRGKDVEWNTKIVVVK